MDVVDVVDVLDMMDVVVWELVLYQPNGQMSDNQA